MSKKISTEDFIQQARDVHGDTYDYSKVVYTGNTDKVTITCKEHGDFRQTPKEHKRGSGCSKCGVKKRILSRRSTIDSFISNAHNIHGDKYSYHLVDYKNNKTKVDIVCPLHGVFSQRPNDHITGNGCPKCGMTRVSELNSLSFDDFLSKATSVHGFKYTYHRHTYVNASSKMTITCSMHGDFEQSCSYHLNSGGCPKCSKERMGERIRLTTQEFIQRAQDVHGDKYDYSETDYVTCMDDVKVRCPEHGLFSVKAIYHTQGQGCRHCAVHGFNVDEPGTVYVLKATKFDRMKIGISNHFERRVAELNRRTPFGFSVMATKEFNNGSDASKCEKYLHSMYNRCNESGYDGATEWFDLDFNIVRDLDNYE